MGPAPVAPAEDEAHREIPDDRAEPLVGVIRARRAAVARMIDHTTQPRRRRRSNRYPMKMTSSVSAARTAERTSSGTVHHAASSGDATTVTVCEQAPCGRRGEPGDADDEHEQHPRPRSRFPNLRKSSPMRRRALPPGSHRRLERRARRARVRRTRRGTGRGRSTRPHCHARDSAASAAARSGSCAAMRGMRASTEYSADWPDRHGQDEAHLPGRGGTRASCSGGRGLRGGEGIRHSDSVPRSDEPVTGAAVRILLSRRTITGLIVRLLTKTPRWLSLCNVWVQNFDHRSPRP